VAQYLQGGMAHLYVLGLTSLINSHRAVFLESIKVGEPPLTPWQVGVSELHDPVPVIVPFRRGGGDAVRFPLRTGNQIYLDFVWI